MNTKALMLAAASLIAVSGIAPAADRQASLRHLGL